MTKQRFYKRFTVITICALLSACASDPETRFYRLQPLSDKPAAGVIANENQRRIGIGPVSIPKLLARKQIVSLLPGNGIEIAEFHQWASPLQDNVSEVLAGNLSFLQNGDLIWAYPWSIYGPVDYRVIVNLVQFGSRPQQDAILEADWTIMHEQDHRIVKHGRSRFEQKLSDPSIASTVQAMNGLLDSFSKELSLALSQLKENHSFQLK